VRALDEEAAKDWLEAVARGEVRAQAPEFVSLEVGNALVKYVRAGSLTPEEADDELLAVLQAPISRIPTGVVARQALALAVTRRLSVYDAAYLALALGTDAILVTADRRLAAEAERSALLPDEGPPA
jgi:predicted nucleic acid-binding protein